VQRAHPWAAQADPHRKRADTDQSRCSDISLTFVPDHYATTLSRIAVQRRKERREEERGEGRRENREGRIERGEERRGEEKRKRRA